jgi:hypothetical protein
MSLKNPVTPPGINPGTVRLVAQRLNHYATSDPNVKAVAIRIVGMNNDFHDHGRAETETCE